MIMDSTMEIIIDCQNSKTIREKWSQGVDVEENTDVPMWDATMKTIAVHANSKANSEKKNEASYT